LPGYHSWLATRRRIDLNRKVLWYPSQEIIMIAVIFEVWPVENGASEYFDLAAELRPLLEGIEGFISIERFESLATKGKYLSLSFWRDEESIQSWRNMEEHRAVQAKGRESIFAEYRIRVASVVRDYGFAERDEAPDDSRSAHG
jgi:heme-degrading monooxygenase HmoA